MPTIGNAVYHGIGNAVILNKNGDSNKFLSTNQSNVNFSKKTITGTGTIIGNDPKFELFGIINDNQFSGEKDDTKIQGRFYGDNAEALNGTLTHSTNDKKLVGTFGGFKIPDNVPDIVMLNHFAELHSF